MENDNTCIVCGGFLGDEPILYLDHMPASAQDIPNKEQVLSDEGIGLSLCRCEYCGLVQFACEPVAYYKDVIRSGGFSTTMVDLRRSQYQKLIDEYQLSGKRFLEVGCGRGEFLSVLTEFPVECFGMEHREDLVKLAKESGLNVVQGFTHTSDTMLEGAPYDVFLSFNFLEHQPDPVSMLSCVYNNLVEGGMGLITVPGLSYILEHDGYYELIRDHIAYYTGKTLRYLLECCGFDVLTEEVINRDTLSVTVRKAAIKKEGIPVVEPLDFSGLKKSQEQIQKQMDEFVASLQMQGKRLAIWGASHQGFTLAATTMLSDKVVYMIDSAPFKQGLFAPASHIPIVAPEHYFEDPVEAILIVAPGYTKEIATIIRSRFSKDMDVFTLRSNHIEAL